MLPAAVALLEVSFAGRSDVYKRQGKCVPCREGTKRMLEILERIVDGKGEMSDLDELEELATMVQSICLLYTSKQLEALGFGNCPICVAKTQYSLTDDQTKLGAPTDFEVTVRNLKISAGAGFIVALTGEIMTMPGLPKVPAAERIDVDETGKIT